MTFAYWLQCLLLLLISILFKIYPPKSINAIYGYRTPKSMENEETWKKANDYSSSLLLKISVCLVFIQIGLSLTMGVNTKTLLIAGGFLTLNLPLVILLTEKHLKK